MTAQCNKAIGAEKITLLDAWQQNIKLCELLLHIISQNLLACHVMLKLIQPGTCSLPAIGTKGITIELSLPHHVHTCLCSTFCTAQVHIYMIMVKLGKIRLAFRRHPANSLPLAMCPSLTNDNSLHVDPMLPFLMNKYKQ